MELKTEVILEPYISGSDMRTMIYIKIFNSENDELLEQSVDNVSMKTALVKAKTALEIFDMINNTTSPGV